MSRHFARESASRLNASTVEDNSYGITLLGDIRTLFRTRSGPTLGSEEILAQLHRMEERPWPEWRERTPLSARQLAMLLQPFGINPIKWKQEGATHRGYLRDSFVDAFSRYLPQEPPQAPPASAQSTYAQNQPATEKAKVADCGADNSSKYKAVADVADSKSLGVREVAEP